MFQVGRFDPRADQETEGKKRKTKSKKRKHLEQRRSSHEGEKKSTLKVIAREAQPTSIKKRDLTDEALDDFDMEQDLLLLESRAQRDQEQEQDGQDADGSVVQDENKERRELPREISQALRMSALPIEEAGRTWDLAPFLVENLKKDGFEQFFPIQALVIPDVISSERHSQILQCRDVCVAAPTGSGKTLAFCLPILNSLASRVVKRLRALVILPSRDLAAQVHQVFQHYAQGSDLQIGLAIGQSDLKQEQWNIMVGEEQPWEDEATRQLRHWLDPANLDYAIGAAFDHLPACCDPTGAIDVLVATPGRLIDHMETTPGFTLQHLRFLIIDEADRLLSQSYHSFIQRIVNAAGEASRRAWTSIEAGKPLKLDKVSPITWRRHERASGPASYCQRVQLRKLLFSATMTKDPQKLAGLGLVNPKHYDARQLNAQDAKMNAGSQRYSMPQGLSEFIVECTAEQKPLILLALLLQLRQSGDIVVVFTSSLDSTHRLARLLQLLWSAADIGDASSVQEFSSALTQKQRTSLVNQCNDAQFDGISVIVCSDGMSRGMDISTITAVVNYDLPAFAKTYVHRCGRTARAGRTGKGISLLKAGQIGQFKKVRCLIEDPDRVETMKVQKDLVRDVFSKYKSCVAALRRVIEAEERGELQTLDPIPSGFTRP